MPLPFLALIAGLLVALGSAPSQAQLTRTDPQHYGQGLNADPHANTGRSLPDYKTPNPRSRVLTRRKRDLSNFGAPDQKLSKACRDGRFRQKIEHRYVAVLNDKVYGAGLGGRAMLHDPQRIAQTGIVYIFIGQGTTNCRVYQVGSPNAT